MFSRIQSEKYNDNNMKMRPEFHYTNSCNVLHLYFCYPFIITSKYIYFILNDMICSFMTSSMTYIQKLVCRAALRSNLYGFFVMSEISNFYIL